MQKPSTRSIGIKVLSVYHIRHEDGTVQFFNEPLSAALFGRVVIVTPDGLVPVERDIPLEKIKRVRQTAKKRVFVTTHSALWHLLVLLIMCEIYHS